MTKSLAFFDIPMILLFDYTIGIVKDKEWSIVRACICTFTTPLFMLYYIGALEYDFDCIWAAVIFSVIAMPAILYMGTKEKAPYFY
jgi:hypothetical protein